MLNELKAAESRALKKASKKEIHHSEDEDDDDYDDDDDDDEESDSDSNKDEEEEEVKGADGEPTMDEGS